MVSNSAKLDCRTKQHTESGVSTSDGSRDMARTRSRRKKKKKMNSMNPIKHSLRGSLIRVCNLILKIQLILGTIRDLIMMWSSY